MGLGYRAGASEVADDYGVAPLPVLDEEVGHRLYHKHVRLGRRYEEDILLSVVNLDDPRLQDVSRHRIITLLLNEDLTAIECFDDVRIDDPHEYIIKIVNRRPPPQRIAFFEGAGLDVTTIFDLVLAGDWGVVCWDSTMFSAGVNRALRRMSIFDDRNQNRVREVKQFLDSTEVPSTMNGAADRD